MSDVASHKSANSDITYPSSVNSDGVDYPDEDAFFDLNGYEKEDDEESEEKEDEDEPIRSLNLHIRLPSSVYRIFTWVKETLNQNPDMETETDTQMLSIAETMNKCLMNNSDSTKECPTVRYLLERYKKRFPANN